MFSLYTARKTKELFGGKGEFAVLDVREQEEFARGHMILASCAPLSRLECMVEDLAPCKQTPVVLVDSGVESDIPRSVRAASVLTRLGYSRLIVLEDGMEAWKKAGFMEFTGVGALGKGFGEYVEEELKLSRLGVDKIKKIIDSDTPSVVIDVRPRMQFEPMSIHRRMISLSPPTTRCMERLGWPTLKKSGLASGCVCSPAVLRLGSPRNFRSPRGCPRLYVLKTIAGTLPTRPSTSSPE